MASALAAQLKTVQLFEALNGDDLARLAERARLRSLPAGRMVFREGEPADSLYVVVSGAVKIFITDAAGAEVVLDTKTAGQYFGEMMLDHRPRSASVVTLEPCEFVVISQADFKDFIRRHPDAAEQVILNLIRVARGMNQRLGSYVERLPTLKSQDLPVVKRWVAVKRWALAGLLVLAIAQFYFMDVLLQIVSLGGLTYFTGR